MYFPRLPSPFPRPLPPSPPPSPNARSYSRAGTTFRFSNSEFRVPISQPFIIFILTIEAFPPVSQFPPPPAPRPPPSAFRLPSSAFRNPKSEIRNFSPSLTSNRNYRLLRSRRISSWFPISKNISSRSLFSALKSIRSRSPARHSKRSAPSFRIPTPR